MWSPWKAYKNLRKRYGRWQSLKWLYASYYNQAIIKHFPKQADRLKKRVGGECLQCGQCCKECQHQQANKQCSIHDDLLTTNHKYCYYAPMPIHIKLGLTLKNCGYYLKKSKKKEKNS